MLNNLTKSQQVSDEEEKKLLKMKYLLVYQFLIELGLEYYLELFKGKNFDSKMLLSSTLASMEDVFHEITKEHIALIWTKAQQHKRRKDYYYDIRD